jgi:hypothetical protein
MPLERLSHELPTGRAHFPNGEDYIMSWTIAGKYVRASATDPDAQAYLQAVEAADGQALEFEVARAIDNFVLGCKADGIWTAIKASCILAGARTRLGALTPLVGTAPTSFNFVDGDYNRKTGLLGDRTRSGASVKYIDSNRASNADPQDNHHLSVYATQYFVPPNNGFFIGAGFTAAGTTMIVGRPGDTGSRMRSSTFSAGFSQLTVPTLIGVSRAQSSSYAHRINQSQTSVSQSSDGFLSAKNFVFAINNNGPFEPTNARLAFYSIGESLNLALLDARVTDLINAFDTAIPS